MNATLQVVEGRSVLQFERRLAHAVDQVWPAITDPGRLRQWFPADVDLDLRPGARIRFVFRQGEGPTLDGEVTEVQPPHLLEYTWDDSVLRWELRAEGGGPAQGCRLIFTFTFGDHDRAAIQAAGWHVCLDLLEALLDGRQPEWSPHARRDELHEGYVERLG